jgi:hypothetical protein
VKRRRSSYQYSFSRIAKFFDVPNEHPVTILTPERKLGKPQRPVTLRIPLSVATSIPLFQLASAALRKKSRSRFGQ